LASLLSQPRSIGGASGTIGGVLDNLLGLEELPDLLHDPEGVGQERRVAQDRLRCRAVQRVRVFLSLSILAPLDERRQLRVLPELVDPLLGVRDLRLDGGALPLDYEVPMDRLLTCVSA
jgi:hypothetical protein